MMSLQAKYITVVSLDQLVVYGLGGGPTLLSQPTHWLAGREGRVWLLIVFLPVYMAATCSQVMLGLAHDGHWHGKGLASP